MCRERIKSLAGGGSLENRPRRPPQQQSALSIFEKGLSRRLVTLAITLWHPISLSLGSRFQISGLGLT